MAGGGKWRCWMTGNWRNHAMQPSGSATWHRAKGGSFEVFDCDKAIPDQAISRAWNPAIKACDLYGFFWSWKPSSNPSPALPMKNVTGPFARSLALTTATLDRSYYDFYPWRRRASRFSDHKLRQLLHALSHRLLLMLLLLLLSSVQRAVAP